MLIVLPSVQSSNAGRHVLDRFTLFLCCPVISSLSVCVMWHMIPTWFTHLFINLENPQQGNYEVKSDIQLCSSPTLNFFFFSKLSFRPVVPLSVSFAPPSAPWIFFSSSFHLLGPHSCYAFPSLSAVCFPLALLFLSTGVREWSITACGTRRWRLWL